MSRTPFVLGFLFVLLALPASGTLLDRTPLAGPRSTLPDAGPGRVVASDTGLFLAHGQRITSDGVRIDQEPVPGTEGVAVAWPGGWLILRSGEAYFLGPEGPPEPWQSVPVPGRFLGAASNGGKLAILEVTHTVMALDADARPRHSRERGTSECRSTSFVAADSDPPFFGS